jgi:hypothetical protein
LDHLLSKDTLEIRPRRGTRPEGSRTSRSAGSRGDIGPARKFGRSPPAPHEGSRPSPACQRRSTRQEARGMDANPSPGVLTDRNAPEWGAWQAVFRCCPAPWPVASVIFHNPVVGHTRKQVCSVVVARIHPRTWTLYGSLESLNRSRRVVTLRTLSVARRARPRMMGSWARRIPAASEVISLSRGMAEGGVRSAWSSS